MRPQVQTCCLTKKKKKKEGALNWWSQDLRLLLGSAEMEVVFSGSLGYVSLTPYHQLPHFWWRNILGLDDQTRNFI
jgi:hypothetical protein